MPSKLIVALIAAGTVGAVAIAGAAISLSNGPRTPVAESEGTGETVEFEAETYQKNSQSVSDNGIQSDLTGSVSNVTINPDDFGAAPDLESFDAVPSRRAAAGGLVRTNFRRHRRGLAFQRTNSMMP